MTETALRDQIAVTLPDGSVRRVARGTTPGDIARAIGPGLAKAALVARVDGALWDLDRPLEADAALAIVTARDEADALEILRHDAAHVMAQAVQELYPGTQVTIGPVIEDGFYYDFARDTPFTEDDLPAIEQRMHEIVDRDEPIAREVWDRGDAIAHFKKIGEQYKAEIIADLPADEPITVYRQGAWMDLCRGPHLPSTRKLGHAFKLMKVAGAYWRGDHRNAMLSRIYGTAWLSEKDLKAYLDRLAEAEKRDHRRLGREMDLFHLQEEAQGSVFWHPKGYVIWQVLEQYIRRRLAAHGYVEVKTPQLLDARFWEQSGHWSKFREHMFVVPDEVPSTEEGKPVLSGQAKLMAIKPMNCPAHIQIFKQGIKSYRDLPIRMAEFGCCHRNEAHGALHGLMRVRQMTQDDAHIFCRADQVTDEVRAFSELLQAVYTDLGFADVHIRFATRPDVRAGEDAVWDKAEAALKAALDAQGLAYGVAPGEGAFYGPKLEFHLKDAIGRSWQCGTLQLDFVLPERLDAAYVAADGSRQRPVMLHRAILGTLERFIGILIEHYAGKLPFWLAPVQAVVATIVSDADSYARAVAARLRDAGVRVAEDLRNEKINYKIREHSHAKVPAILVIGKREAEDKQVALRWLDGKSQEMLALDAAVDRLGTAARPPA
ncbi:MAG: threonine--tRNA ligase [Alphaproteobacteria bacterium]|nr:MAG: threonine--tRNA ligase [Alphaproteobacteria bacterium]